MDEIVLKTLRAMTWERAKGELQALLVTYYNDPHFGKASEEINGFIKRIDGEALKT